MSSPYAIHKRIAIMRTLFGVLLIGLGLQLDNGLVAFLVVLAGTWICAGSVTRLIRIWAYEQQLLSGTRRTYQQFSRASLPRQVYWLLLAVAEVDGRADATERETVRRFVLDRFVDPVTTADLQTWEAQRVPAEQVPTLALQMRRVLSPAECETIFFWCCQTAFSDGRFNPDEHSMLHQVARGLGLGAQHARAVFLHAKAHFLQHGEGGDRWSRDGRGFGQSGTSSSGWGRESSGGGSSRGQRPTAAASPRRRALQVLGLEGDPSDDEIKKRHRELVKRYHPDAHAHLGPVAAEESSRRFREIQEAYEQLTG